MTDRAPVERELTGCCHEGRSNGDRIREALGLAPGSTIDQIAAAARGFRTHIGIIQSREARLKRQLFVLTEHARVCAGSYIAALRISHPDSCACSACQVLALISSQAQERAKQTPPGEAASVGIEQARPEPGRDAAEHRGEEGRAAGDGAVGNDRSGMSASPVLRAPGHAVSATEIVMHIARAFGGLARPLGGQAVHDACVAMIETYGAPVPRELQRLRAFEDGVTELLGPPIEGTVKMLERLRARLSAPIPMRITCPDCGELHIDEGEFATTPHRNHSCQKCGLTWQPATVPTVGVRFLPGYKNDELEVGTPHEANAEARS